MFALPKLSRCHYGRADPTKLKVNFKDGFILLEPEMKRIYSLIWNKYPEQLVVACEHAPYASYGKTLTTLCIGIVVTTATAPALAQTSIPSTTNIAGFIDSNWNNVTDNFILTGNSDWGATIPNFSTTRTQFTLDGGGNTLLVTGLTGGLMLQPASVSNATSTFSNVTLSGNNVASSQLFYYDTANVISTLNLNNVQIRDFSFNQLSNGTVITQNGLNSILNVNASNGLRISNNTSGPLYAGFSSGQSAVIVNGGTLNFNGDITFADNTSGSSAGALSEGSTGFTAVNFNGTTVFVNNSNTNTENSRGGAIAVEPNGTAILTFNGVSTFNGNYHNSGTIDKQGAGGAMYVDTNTGTGTATVIFNNTATFSNNYVTGGSSTSDVPIGGAIYVTGNSVINFNAPATFQNNYAYYSLDNGGGGGAIRNTGATVNISSDTNFIDNGTTGTGGAIKSRGLITLNATTGNILFQGNRQFMTMTNPTTLNLNSGVPNAIYMDAASGTLVLNAVGAAKIIFNDPIASVADATITKTGSGEVIFYGNNGVDALYDSAVLGNTTVQGGSFTLANGATYGSATSGTFGVDNGASVNGDAGSILRGQTININAGGTVNATSGTFTLNSPTVNHAGSINIIGTNHTVLNVTGNYNGQNGHVNFNTQLSGDESATGKMLVQGNTSGTTYVSVTQSGGAGATTLNGIELIEVTGNSAGEFIQSGRIAAGAYEYFLNRGLNANANNWYLTSFMTEPVTEPEIERPEIGSYTVNLADANTMFINGLHNHTTKTAYIDPLTGEQRFTSLWMHHQGGRNDSRDQNNQIDTNSNRYIVQLGGDVAQWSQTEQDYWNLGLMAGYGSSNSTSTSKIDGYHSSGSVSGYSVGVYGDWYANHAEKTGWTADGGLLYAWFNNTVHGEGLDAERYQSKGFIASVATGYIYKFNENCIEETFYYIQPKVGLTWMGIKADDHTESNGTTVSGAGDGNLQSKLGIKLGMRKHSTSDAGDGSTFEPFVETSWIHNSNEYGVTMNNVTIKQAGASNIGELKLGVDGKLNARLSLSGYVSQQTGNHGYNDFSGTLALMYRF